MLLLVPELSVFEDTLHSVWESNPHLPIKSWGVTYYANRVTVSVPYHLGLTEPLIA